MAENTQSQAPIKAEESTGVGIETATQESPKTVVKRKKAKRTVAAGQLHILATFNNTLISFTDANGGVLSASSAGSCGFRGSKKGTAYAAQVAGEKAAQIAKQNYGLAKVDVFIKGVGHGRDAAIRVLPSHNIQVEAIYDVTSIPHGGVRPKKARRV